MIGSDDTSLDEMGRHGFGGRSNIGERFVGFIFNRISTDNHWRSNQIDHITISNRFRSCFLNARNKRGADIGFESYYYLLPLLACA